MLRVLYREGMDSISARLLRNAAEVVGGEAALRRELQVPEREFQRWLDGIDPLPRAVFLKLADILLAHRPPAAPYSPAAAGAERGIGSDERRS